MENLSPLKMSIHTNFRVTNLTYCVQKVLVLSSGVYQECFLVNILMDTVHILMQNNFLLAPKSTEYKIICLEFKYFCCFCFCFHTFRKKKWLQLPTNHKYRLPG